jgi:hypothetical protein
MALKKHAAALKFMEDNVGQHEVPMGSNTGPFVLRCQASTWLPGSGWPWCCATIIKAWTVGGFALPWKGAGAYALLDWYKAHLPKTVVPLKNARPGAAVVFNIGTGHVGMLEKPYDGGSSVHTIDGNWQDAVTRVAHPVGLVCGVVDPVETGLPEAAKPPRFEVATSANGHSKLVYVSGEKAISRKLGQLLNRYGGVTIRRRKK